jgi:hypothetical protein
MNWREEGYLILRPVAIAPLILLLLSAPARIASAQLPARVETPYTLIDAESRTFIEGGVETPLKGNGPLTGYGYLFLLVNFAYRFPIWPGQDLVHLQLLADYARVDYVRGHSLPRSNLAGVGANLSVAIMKRVDLVVGYGYGINAPRGRSFGGQEFDAQFEFKW